MAADRERVPQLVTSGVLAAALGQPLHRVLNVLATRGSIRPAARAGTLRLYTRAAIQMVDQELMKIDAARARSVGLQLAGRRKRGGKRRRPATTPRPSTSRECNPVAIRQHHPVKAGLI